MLQIFKRFGRKCSYVVGWMVGLMVALTISSCAPRYQTIEGTALGTLYRITASGRITPTLQADLTKLFEEANKEMSVFDKNSLLSRINRGETDSLSANIIYCIEMAHRVSELSEGAYDITIQPLVDAYGFAGDDPDFTPNLDSLLPLVDYRNISIENGLLVRPEGVQIGLNSIAKGAVVDMAAALFVALHRNAGTANFGKPVYIVRLYAQFLFDFAAHLVCPRLGAKHARF